MANRLPAPNLKNLHAALRTESVVMIEFANSLNASQWKAPSKAAGWSIADMVAHIGSTAHNMYTPAGIQAARQPSLEVVNEDPVQVRRAWNRQQVMAEFKSATRTSARMLAFMRHTPMRALPMRLNELGSFPMVLLVGGALVFDLHTHLRHDMAPALDIQAPPTDANRMRAVLDWMTAVLSNQTAQAPASGIDAGLTLTLSGPGGNTWWIDNHGLAAPGSHNPAARITAPAITFPDWGTQRSSWRDADVEITGNTDLALRFLDTVNVI
ncbi:MAG: maleylpyruvate isomerase N-terminal domain-containing protein [Actinomycetota bacterium]